MSASVIVATPEQLAELVRGAVAEALAEARDDAAPVLRDRAGLARALGVGTGTVDRLRRHGMPYVMIGDAPRFDVTDCVAWLKAQTRNPTGGAVASCAAPTA